MENELHLQHGKDLYPQFYDYYRNKIRFGDYKPGDKLPSYKALSDKYAVSLTTIKTAYQKLEREGYIRLTSKGSFVVERSSTPADSVSDSLDEAIQNALRFGATKKDISEAIENIIEKYC